MNLLHISGYGNRSFERSAEIIIRDSRKTNDQPTLSKFRAPATGWIGVIKIPVRNWSAGLNIGGRLSGRRRPHNSGFRAKKDSSETLSLSIES